MKKPAGASMISLGGKPVTAAEFMAGFARRAAANNASRLLWLFRLGGTTADPRWILAACAALRAGGMRVRRELREAEVWARKARRRVGKPAKAEQYLRLAELLAEAEYMRDHDPHDRDERGRLRRPLLNRIGWQRWLSREAGLPIGHLRVLLHRLSDMELAGPPWAAHRARFKRIE